MSTKSLYVRPEIITEQQLDTQEKTPIPGHWIVGGVSVRAAVRLAEEAQEELGMTITPLAPYETDPVLWLSEYNQGEEVTFPQALWKIEDTAEAIRGFGEVAPAIAQLGRQATGEHTIVINLATGESFNPLELVRAG